MALGYFTHATFNARNLVNPGVTYYGSSRYTQAAFDAKLDWMAEQLYRMDADFVCMQEVFHADALEALLARYDALLAARHSPAKARLDKYDHVRFAPNTASGTGGQQPGLAFLSRREIRESTAVQDISDRPIAVGEGADFSYRLSRLSRPIQIVRVDLGKGVDGYVFNAHLKSKLPRFVGNDPAADEANALFMERSAAVFRALALRAGGALALRREIVTRARGSAVPIIVAGDLNDEIGAVSTEIVAGEAPWRRLPGAVKALYWDVELYSAVRSHLRRSETASVYTHVHNGAYGTIDHVLVSQEFYYRNADRIGDINFVTCYNDHLTDDTMDGAPPLGAASDHGQIAVRMSIDPDRLPQD